MIVFEVSLNGELLVRAGKNDLTVLNQIITASGVLGPESLGTKAKKDGFELSLYVGGSTSENFVRWIEEKHISVGDEIVLRVTDSSAADPDILPNYTQEQIARMKKHSEAAEKREYEKAKKLYFQLCEKYEEGNG